ncbi:MAG: stress-induced protein [Alphaproteobacteria bacterium]|nr:stress-induced protein [Alphaproteobacteria bacterium]
MDADRHREISSKGGRMSRGGGFAANPELAREAGRKGGQASGRRNLGED